MLRCATRSQSHAQLNSLRCLGGEGKMFGIHGTRRDGRHSMFRDGSRFASRPPSSARRYEAAMLRPAFDLGSIFVLGMAILLVAAMTFTVPY